MAKKIVASKSELTAVMDKVLQEGLEKVKVIIKQTIDEFIRMWYDDYTPKKYQRTYQLLNACTSTELKKKGNKYSVQIYMDYRNMHHMSYWDNLDANGNPRPNREKTEQEELKVLRMADGRELTKNHLLPRNKQQRGITGGGLHENVLKNPGKHGVRFWTDAVDTLAGRGGQIPYSINKVNAGNIFDAFEEFLRAKGFNVTRVSHTPEYFLPLLY